MERYRRRKFMIIIALILAISGLTIGFAAFTTVLTISAQANVTPDASSFSVKFSRYQNSQNETAVPASSSSTGVVTTNGVINNNLASPTISNLSATFTSPGQYAEYTFYARNVGQYRAYLNSVNFVGMKVCGGKDATPSLVQAACDSITVTVTVGNASYTQTTAISGHSLETNTGERVVVRINYASGGALADGEFSVDFGNITMVYSTVDDSTFVPPVTGSDTNTKTINYIMKQGAVSDSSVDFGSSNGLSTVNNTAYIRNGTQNNTNPIYYYRGNVTKNNVKFANFCWKIVRTTETGGVKLIYNGVPAANGSCNNTGEASQIGDSSFDSIYRDVDDVIDFLSYIYPDGTDSTIKGVIDAWYAANMIPYTNKLEDTSWCNDRSLSNNNGWLFDGYDRLVSNNLPRLECNVEYQMTVASTDIGKHLKYPVALLTADEITFAGSGYNGYSASSYLNTGWNWWTLSPIDFDGSAVWFEVQTNGILRWGNDTSVGGVRPSVSLAPNTEISGGDGSTGSPYVIS